jgi:hypothetical protein
MTPETLTNPTWRIYVMGWQSLTSVQSVVQRVLALLPGARSGRVPGDAPGEGIGVIEQEVITWSNPGVVVTA